MSIRFIGNLLVPAALVSSIAFADQIAKDAPGYLREHHAGVETLTTQKPAADVYSIIVNGVTNCCYNHANELLSPDVKGIIAQSSVHRRIKNEIADDRKSAYVIYGVKGFWYVPVFEFDLVETDHGVDVTFYFEHDGRMSHAAYANMKSWIDGDSSKCEGAQ